MKQVTAIAPDAPQAKPAQLTALLDEQEKGTAALRQKIGKAAGQL